MHIRSDVFPVSGSARSSVSRHSFLLLVFVLVVCLGSLDIAIHGPFTTYVAWLLVVRPVEREWGFHAEWRDYGSSDDAYSLLTVVDVASGGAFDRAGIRPGFAFAPRRSATGGPWFGGVYSLFADGANPVRLRMLAQPSNRGLDQFYEISR
jgi:hypothetical protein